MKVLLNKNIALRGYWRIPYAIYNYQINNLIGINEDEFNILIQCDGKHNIKYNDLLGKLIFDKKICFPIKDGKSKLDDRQRYRLFFNPYFESISLQITGKCNYNCLHCFNACDNAPLNYELSFAEIVNLLDQAEECGINGIMLTGGEPLVHPKFLDIYKEIYKHNMFVKELNTNGYLITQNLLDEIKKHNPYPIIKISFDGVGYHDWMRNFKGAEQKTIEAIKLCVANNLPVAVTMNINRRNFSSFKETNKLLNSLGVFCIRYLPTVDTPRWKKNADKKTFTIEEYLDAAFEITKDWIENDYKTQLIVWQVLSIYHHLINLEQIHDINQGQYDCYPVCKLARFEIAIGANGNLYPCFPVSSTFDHDHICLGNIKKDKLINLIQYETNYMKLISHNLKERYNYSKKCHNCEFYATCWGGCPVLAYKEHGSYISYCNINCVFYKKKYFKKFQSLCDEKKYKLKRKIFEKNTMSKLISSKSSKNF